MLILNQTDIETTAIFKLLDDKYHTSVLGNSTYSKNRL